MIHDLATTRLQFCGGLCMCTGSNACDGDTSMMARKSIGVHGPRILMIKKNCSRVIVPSSDVHQARIRILASKATLLHTWRMRFERIQRPLGTQARAHGAKRAHRALLLHERHRAPAAASSTTAAIVTTTSAAATATAADGKVDAEAHRLLYDVARGGVVHVLDTRAKGAVGLGFWEEHGREETAYLSACRCDRVARVHGESVRAPVKEAGEPSLYLAHGGRNE